MNSILKKSLLFTLGLLKRYVRFIFINENSFARNFYKLAFITPLPFLAVVTLGHSTGLDNVGSSDIVNFSKEVLEFYAYGYSISVKILDFFGLLPSNDLFALFFGGLLFANLMLVAVLTIKFITILIGEFIVYLRGYTQEEWEAKLANDEIKKRNDKDRLSNHKR